MKKYDEAPWYWYAALLLLSFFAGALLFSIIDAHLYTDICFASGLIVVLKGQTTLPWWSYIVALILGAFVTVCHAHKVSHR
jgi:fructose-specific phosphotransferase system IIC component